MIAGFFYRELIAAALWAAAFALVVKALAS
jgi:hypothetical protein